MASPRSVSLVALSASPSVLLSLLSLSSLLAACGDPVTGMGAIESPVMAAPAPAPARPCNFDAGAGPGVPCGDTPVLPGAQAAGAAGTVGGPPAPPQPDAAVPACNRDVFGASVWGQRLTSTGLMDSMRSIEVHGQACLDCHTQPATPEIPQFDFAGRVFGDDGQPLGLVEVFVTNTVSGQPIATYSTANGYFWWPQAGPAGYGSTFGADRAVFPSPVGVRTQGGAKASMCAVASTGNCGTCHGKTTPPIDTKPGP